MDAKNTEHAHHTLRVEDDPLLRGAGRFAADAPAERQVHAHFVRSPHAFARIKSIQVEDARKAKGVVAVLTAAEMKANGVDNIARHPPIPGRNGAKLVIPVRPPLAEGRVMHVGQPVACVIAETLHAAQDAAELIRVDYEEITPVTDIRAAVSPGAPQLWPEAAGNVAVDWPGLAADPDANTREVDRIMDSAAHVARVTLMNQRIVVATMEPRGGTAYYSKERDDYHLRVCAQGPVMLRDTVVSVMGIDKSKLRITAEEVGGAFGMKTPVYPEYPVLLVGSRLTGRPVHWMATRSESFLSDNQARDTYSEAALAIDEKGKFLALRIRNLSSLGGFLATTGAHLATNNFARCLPGMYNIPRVDAQVKCVFTNAVPIGPYRGAGRPEANYIIERLVDEAARLTGIDPVALRKRNLIGKSAIPFKTAVGTTYDSGDFRPILDKALALADVANFKKRRRESAKRGKFRGLGVSCFLEHSGGVPLEGATLGFSGDDTLTLFLNVHNTGQGHATVFPRLVADRLGIPAEKVKHRHGDTNFNIAGAASVGSRSAMTAGSAIVKTIEVMLAKGRNIAAGMLEAAETDIDYANGHFKVVGTDKHVSLFEVANRAAELKKRGEIAESLDTYQTNEVPQTFPNGCHIAEVEVDPDTGKVQVLSYAAVDDCGTVLDNTIVHGQLHGGLAQGLGQAIMEAAVYDSDSGQLVSGSFMDYGMPRADDMPDIADDTHSVPATTNPLGVKGVGEAGTTASLAAIMNAIADAIPGGAGTGLDMPATPEKVWAACQKAKA